MTIKQYNFCFAEIPEYTDRDAYISDLALASIWGDVEDADIPADRIDQLGQIWDAHHRTIKEIASDAGLSCRKVAERFRIPYSTMENWSRGINECPLYTRLMMQECLGIFSVKIS